MSTTTALEIQTPFGTALPPAQRHAITVHIAGWDSIVRFKDHDPKIFAALQSMYPRFVLHKDILELTQKIIAFAGVENPEQGCYMFPSLQAARYCIEFATSPARGKDGTIPSDKIRLRGFKASGATADDTSSPSPPPTIVVYAVFFPAEFTASVHSFWLNAGTGISSRLAEDTLTRIASLEEFAVEADFSSSSPASSSSSPSPALQAQAEVSAHATLKERISRFMNRAPADPAQSTRHVSPSDVYLFSTGMAAIYWVHRFLLNRRDDSTGPSALFGFSFHSTIHVLEDHGPGVEFFGLGDDSDLKALEKHLASCSGAAAAAATAAGGGGQDGKPSRRVQAIYTEFPSNPLLNTPSLTALRALADRYGALLIVDDTIGSFASVDVLPAADVVVSSLTKSFSGYADVMAGSAVLNPSSRRYAELKALFDREFHNDFYARDAQQLEVNSRDYVARSAVLNRNAERLVAFLAQKAEEEEEEEEGAGSCVKKVFYPTTTVTDGASSNYTPFMRQPTAEVPNPGYGCLFSVEFVDEATTMAFYDSLHVHKGPHLGAHLTIALPYTVGIYGNDLAWAAKYNIRPTQVRISVGLEETETLVETFRSAVEAADRAWRRRN